MNINGAAGEIPNIIDDKKIAVLNIASIETLKRQKRRIMQICERYD